MEVTAIRLQELRRSRGLTQEETARLIMDIDVRRWKSYEYDDRNMPLDILKATAKLFNVTTDYLLGLSDEMQPQAKEFQQSTGLSESAIANISKYKDSSVYLEVLNTILSSEEFINTISSLIIAKTPCSVNLKNIKTRQEKSLTQGIKLYSIVHGDKKTITDEETTLTGQRLKEWHSYLASKSMDKLMNRIMEGDKNNGTR